MQLELEAEAAAELASIGGIVTRNGSSQVMPVSLIGFGGQQNGDIIPSKILNDQRTWVVIHGRRDNPESHQMLDLAEALSLKGDQVVLVDWEQAAADFVRLPLVLASIDFGDLRDASWTPAVGRWVAQQLLAVGLSPDNINLAGHSHGTYVAYFAADAIRQSAGKVNALIALDPALNPFLANNDVNVSQISFSSVANTSWAFRSSLLGSQYLANTAAYSFDVDSPNTLNPLTEHNLSVSLLSSLLLTNSGVGLVPFQYDIFMGNNFVRRFDVNANDFEGTITVSVTHPTNGENDDWWHTEFVGFTYKDVSSGVSTTTFGVVPVGSSREISGFIAPAIGEYSHKFLIDVRFPSVLSLRVVNASLSEQNIFIRAFDTQEQEVAFGHEKVVESSVVVGLNNFEVLVFGSMLAHFDVTLELFPNL